MNKFILFFAFILGYLHCNGQEVVFSTSKFENKPANIFASFERNQTAGGACVQKGPQEIVIDYANKKNLHSFVFDQDFNLKEEISDVQLPSFMVFLGAYGPAEKRIYAFDTKKEGQYFFCSNTPQLKRGRMMEVYSSKTIGTFITKGVFYHVGYDHTGGAISITSFDQSMTRESKIIYLDDFAGMTTHSDLMKKQFNEETFIRSDYTDFNYLDQFSNHKYYVEGEHLFLTFSNNSLSEHHLQETYFASVNLKTHVSRVQKFESPAPKLDGISYLKPNAQVQNGKLFVVNGNKKGFNLHVFDLASNKKIHSSFQPNSSLEPTTQTERFLRAEKEITQGHTNIFAFEGKDYLYLNLRASLVDKVMLTKPVTAVTNTTMVHSGGDSHNRILNCRYQYRHAKK